MKNPLSAIEKRNACRVNISLTSDDKKKLNELSKATGHKPTSAAYALFKDALEKAHLSIFKKEDKKS